MQIAVSGATGFIGHHVLLELSSRGISASALTRSAEERRLQPGVSRWVEMDIAHPPHNPFYAMGKPDVLVHLAWGGLPNYQSDHHVKLELPAQLAFLTRCVEGGLRRLVVTGTCYEYGLACGELVEDAPIRPCTKYGFAKYELYRALANLSQRHAFDMAWLRLFYLYGEGQSEKSLYNSLHAAIIRGDKSFDMSGGEQLRDFLPIGEAARIIIEIALRKNVSGIFNVCSGRPMLVKEIAESWVAEFKGDIRINLGRIPYSPDEPMAFWGSRKKIEKLIGVI